MNAVDTLRLVVALSRELPAANRVLQLLDRLGLDLPDTLPRDLEYPPHLFKGICVPVSKAIAQADDLPLAVGEGLEQGLDLLAEKLISSGLFRSRRATVLDELAETTIFAFSNRPVKAYRSSLLIVVKFPGVSLTIGACIMSLVVEATYEEGVLKLGRPLPLDEHQKVRVTVEPSPGWAERTYGLARWTGDPETLRRIAEDPELGIREAR